MRIRNIAVLAVVSLGLAGCGNTEAKRALSGGAIGGVSAVVLGANTTLGVVIGAAAGIMCNDISPNYCLR